MNPRPLLQPADEHVCSNLDSRSPAWEDRIIVVVSHDRFFLDEVCGDVLHVSGVAKRLTQTHGSYSVWAKRRAEQQKAFARTVELRRAEIAELKTYAGHGFKYGGSSSSINKMQMKAKQVRRVWRIAAVCSSVRGSAQHGAWQCAAPCRWQCAVVRHSGAAAEPLVALVFSKFSTSPRLH